MFNDNYNFTFYFNVTTDTEFKTFDITITFEKYGYDNQTFDVHFDVRRRDVTIAVLKESIAQDNETEYLVAYLNNLEFNFTLTDLNSTVINDFTVDNSTNVTYYGGTSYDFNFPADVIGYFSANITFTRFGYNSTYWYFNVKVDPRNTTLTELGGFINNSIPLDVYFQDVYSLNFNISDDNTTTAITTFFTPVPLFTPSTLNYNSSGSYGYTFYFNTTIDTFTVELSFNRYGYENKTFIAKFTVAPCLTSTGYVDYPNNTHLDSLNYTDVFTFEVEWNDTVHDISLYDDNLDIVGTAVPYIEYMSFNSGMHVFRINATKLGTYNAMITFGNISYVATSYNLTITVGEAHTAIVDYEYTTLFDIDRSTNFTFWVVWNDTDHVKHVDDDSVVLYVNESLSYTNTTLVQNVMNSPGNHSFTFNSTEKAIYNVTLIFEIENYTVAIYTLWIDVGATNTTLTGSLGTGQSITVQFNDTYDFWLYWNNSEDGSPLNASIIEFDNSTHQQFFKITMNDNGNHTFTFKPEEFYQFVITIILKKVNYRSKNFTITFNLEKADTTITGYLLSPLLPFHNRSYSDQVPIWVTWYDIRGNPIIDVIPLTDLPLFVFFTGESNGNYTFLFDAHDLGNYSFTITFSDPRFLTATYNLTIIVYPAVTSLINLTIANGTAVDNLYYTDIVEFSVTWYDQRHDRLLNKTDISSYITGSASNYITVLSVNNGNHSFRFTCSDVGTFTLTITFSMNNYTTSDYTLIFIVYPAVTSLINLTIANGTAVDNLYYTDIAEFSVTWYDQRHDCLLNKTDINSYITGSASNYITVLSVNNGIHSFSFTCSDVGTFTLAITFSMNNYTTSIYNLSFIISSNPSGTAVGGFSSGTIFNYTYGENDSFILRWRDQQHSVPITSATLSWNMTENLFNFTGEDNGDYYYHFNALLMGNYSVYITLEHYGYHPLEIIIGFSVSPVTTSLPVAITPFSTEILFGDMIEVAYSWTNTTSGDPYTNATIKLTIDDVQSNNLIDYQSISPTGSYQVIIDTSELIRGSRNFTLYFEKYGHVNRSISVIVVIRGHTISIIFSVPDNLTQGETFVIQAFVFINDIVASGSQIKRYRINYRAIYLNVLLSGITYSHDYGYSYYKQQEEPLVGESLSFEVWFDYVNGSTIVFNGTETTDSDGIATYLIPDTATQNAVAVTKIAASYSGSDFNDPIILDYPIPGGSIIIQRADELINLLIQLVPLAVLGTLIGSVILIRRRRKEGRGIQDIQAADTDRIADVSSINKIFCRHIDGVTFYNEDLIKESEDTDANTRLMTAITAFIDDVSDKSKVIEGFERNERGKLFMLSYHGKKATITVISTDKVSKFIEEGLESIINEIESSFSKELDAFYSSDLIASDQVKKFIRKHLPFEKVAPKPEVKKPVPKPEVKKPVPKPEVKKPVSKPEVKKPVPKPEAKKPEPRPEAKKESLRETRTKTRSEETRTKARSKERIT
jgi:hypothetical protein